MWFWWTAQDDCDYKYDPSYNDEKWQYDYVNHYNPDDLLQMIMIMIMIMSWANDHANYGDPEDQCDNKDSDHHCVSFWKLPIFSAE